MQFGLHSFASRDVELHRSEEIEKRVASHSSIAQKASSASQIL